MRCWLLAGLTLFFVAPPAFAAFAIFQTYSTVAYSGAFQGNPNPSISAITPSISCSRSSGQTPAFVQCSASATTATGSSNPYEDLEYTWNFGDPSGAETFTNPVSGNTVNANNKQWGPEATYVYRTAGTKTITLNVRGCTSGPAAGGICSGAAYTSAQATATFTVTAFSPTNIYWFNTSGAGSTCSQASPCSNIGLITTHTGSLVANNTQYNIDCGQTFAGTPSDVGLIEVAGSATVTGLRFVAAGPDCPGVAPVVEVNGGSSVTAFYIDAAGAGNIEDIVVSGIQFTDGGSATIGSGVVDIFGGSGGTVSDIYLDNRASGGVSDTLGVGGAEDINIEANTALLQNVVVWGGTYASPVSGLNCIGVLGTVQQWYAVIGASISGNGSGGSGPTFCHDIYAHTQYHFLARWNVGGATCTGASCTPTRNYTIKWALDCNNINGQGGSDDCVPGYVCPTVCYAQYELISENDLIDTKAGVNISQNTNNPAVTRVKQIVVQQNLFNSLAGDGAGILQPITAETLTVRDNRECNSADIFLEPNGDSNSTAMSSAIYRNLHYDTAGDGFAIWTGITYIGTPTQVMTDNTVESTAGTPTLVNIDATAKWTADRNSYYDASASGNYLKIAGTGVTFATWQGDGLDVNGHNGVNPSWPSPSTCNFGSWPYN